MRTTHFPTNAPSNRPSATHDQKPESLWQMIREALQLTRSTKKRVSAPPSQSPLFLALPAPIFHLAPPFHKPQSPNPLFAALENSSCNFSQIDSPPLFRSSQAGQSRLSSGAARAFVIISKGTSSVEKRSERMFGLANLTIWKAKQSRLLFSNKGMNKNLPLKGIRAASENE